MKGCFAFEKIKNKKSSEVTVISVNDISFLTTYKAAPFVQLKNGKEYYLPTSLEDYKCIFEGEMKFVTADRCYSVNIYNAEELNITLERLTYPTESKEESHVFIARKYFPIIKKLATSIGLKITK